MKKWTTTDTRQSTANNRHPEARQPGTNNNTDSDTRQSTANNRHPEARQPGTNNNTDSDTRQSTVSSRKIYRKFTKIVEIVPFLTIEDFFIMSSLLWNNLQTLWLWPANSSLVCIAIRGLQRDVVYLGWPIAPSYMSPNVGGGGEFRGLSQFWVQYTGAQLNFEDLTPYLTYDCYL